MTDTAPLCSALARSGIPHEPVLWLRMVYRAPSENLDPQTPKQKDDLPTVGWDDEFF